MQTIEIEMPIGNDGSVQLPEQYHQIYGQKALFVIMLPDAHLSTVKQINPMNYSNTVNWPVDGMDYQRKVREEWQ